MTGVEEGQIRLITYGKGKRHFHLLYDESTKDWWVDLKGLPQTCFLCACFDSTPIIQYQVGPRTKREFVGLKWVMEEWGGDPELVETIAKAVERAERADDKCEK